MSAKMGDLEPSEVSRQPNVASTSVSLNMGDPKPSEASVPPKISSASASPMKGDSLPSEASLRPNVTAAVANPTKGDPGPSEVLPQLNPIATSASPTKGDPKPSETSLQRTAISTGPGPTMSDPGPEVPLQPRMISRSASQLGPSDRPDTSSLTASTVPHSGTPIRPATGDTDIITWPASAKTDGSLATTPPTANSARTADQDQGNPEQRSPPSNSDTSKVSSTGPRPYAYVEEPEVYSWDVSAEIKSYGDIRSDYSPGTKDVPHNLIVTGAQVVFIGSTRIPNEMGEGVYEIGIPYGTQFFVNRLFNDKWAELLKLDEGLEPYEPGQLHGFLNRLRNTRGPKIVRVDGINAVAMKPHPVLVVYAPLCAFTLSSNYRSYEARRNAKVDKPEPKRTCEGGIVKAAPRSTSATAERDAKMDRMFYLRLGVYRQYQEFCNRSRATMRALHESVERTGAPGYANGAAENPASHQDLKQAPGGKSIGWFGQVMSRAGNVGIVKNTASRVKNPFKPQSGPLVDLPRNRMDTPPGHANGHPSRLPMGLHANRRANYANPNLLSAEGSIAVSPFPPQIQLAPFDTPRHSTSESARRLLSSSDTTILDSNFPWLATSDNRRVAQSSDGTSNVVSRAHDSTHSPAAGGSGAVMGEGEPHPGTAVVSVSVLGCWSKFAVLIVVGCQ